jgi:site-specific recombinase XerD
MQETGNLEHSTLHLREAAIKSFFEWLTTIEGGNLRDSQNSPYGRDGSLPYIVAKPNRLSPKFISPELVISLLKGFHNECERCMFHAQYDMGLRLSEIIGLVSEAIPDESVYNSAYEFIPVVVKRAKGRGGQRPGKVTLISRAVLKRIKRYHSSKEYRLSPDWDINDPNKPVFLTSNHLAFTNRNSSKQFKLAVRRAGLSDNITTHWMRHGTAYSVLRSNSGKDYQDRMLMVQQMLGHRDLRTTEIYTQISPAMLMALTKQGKETNRLEEAEFIRNETFLGPLQHTEKRGHNE